MKELLGYWFFLDIFFFIYVYVNKYVKVLSYKNKIKDMEVKG